MHPAFFRGVASGEINKSYYNPELLSSTYIVRTQHQLFNEIREGEGLEKVYYKLAANNPRNPVNKADAIEAKLITLFNANRQVKESEEIVTVDGHKYLHYAIPFLENQQRCMRCHGDPEDAPPGLRAMYPEEGGFHEKVGDIRAIESIKMPIDDHIYTGYIVSGAAAAGLCALLIFIFISVGLRKKVREKTGTLAEEINLRKASEDKYRILIEETSDLITNVDANGFWSAQAAAQVHCSHK